MFKAIIIFIGLLCSLYTGQSQNLVPNPSFEDTVNCPLGPASTSSTLFWYTPTGTSSDYYNSCSPPYPFSLVSVPMNWVGTQSPKNGDAYIGLGIDFGQLNLNYREYIQVKLLEQLQRGIIYQLSFHISLADSSNFALAEIGGLLSDMPVGQLGDFIINRSPQITSSKGSYLTDVNNWMQVKGYVISNGSEKYLTLGYFLSNDYADTLEVHEAFFLRDKAYYYVDEVSLIKISNQEIPNIFTPNGDGINDVFDLEISCEDCGLQLQIYNRWGQQLANTNTFSWDGTYEGVKCPSGVYYYVIHDSQGNVSPYSGFVQLQNN